MDIVVQVVGCKSPSTRCLGDDCAALIRYMLEAAHVPPHQEIAYASHDGSGYGVAFSDNPSAGAVIGTWRGCCCLLRGCVAPGSRGWRGNDPLAWLSVYVDHEFATHDHRYNHQRQSGDPRWRSQLQAIVSERTCQVNHQWSDPAQCAVWRGPRAVRPGWRRDHQ